MNAKDKALVAEAIRQMELALTPEGYRGEGKLKDANIVAIQRHKDLVTYWSSINTDDTIYHNTNQYCHAGLSDAFHYRWGDAKGRVPRLIVHRIQWENNPYRQLPHKVVDNFLSWLTLKSPYARVFVTKGGKTNRKRGYLVARTNVPANLMAGGLFAARMITEHYGNIVWSWWKLVERGVHPSIAFVHAHTVSCKDHENIVITNQDWHTPLSGSYCNREYVLNFKEGNMVSPLEKYNVCLTYETVHGLWGSRYDNEYCYKLREFKEAVKVGFKPKANPFLDAKAMVDKCPIDAFMDLYAAYLIDFYAEIEEEELKVA